MPPSLCLQALAEERGWKREKERKETKRQNVNRKKNEEERGRMR